MSQDSEPSQNHGRRPAPFMLEEVPNYEPDQRMQ